MYEDFKKYFNANFISQVSSSFFGVMKNKRICGTCKRSTYTFNNLSFIDFDLEATNKQYPNLQKYSLNDLFACQNTIMVNLGLDKYVMCTQCGSIQPHTELKQFFNLPIDLVIVFNRGENFQYGTPVDHPEKLDLAGQVDYQYGATKYSLYGVIKRIHKEGKEKFISDCKIGEQWNEFDDSKTTVINSPCNRPEGEVIMLFYEIMN